MQKKPFNYLFRFLIVSVLLVANISCDQVSKKMARDNFSFYDPIRLVNTWIGVTLTHVENQGAFLSLGSTLTGPLRSVLLEWLPALVLLAVVLVLYLKRDLDLLTIIATCFVIGGGAGNLYDRVMFGSVTDFVHLDFRLFQTGIFNMADVSIMIGAFIIFIRELFFRHSAAAGGSAPTA